jgi:FkbH-like protein
LYVDEGRRKKALQTSASIEDYLESLEIAVTININRKSEIQRISQLTNKTNQFNLTTRRYSETDIAKFMENEQVFDIQVSDKFGDMGLVGVIIVNENKIDTFLMSCRVLGRQIESSVMSYVCKGLNNDALLAEYVPTKKNQMVLNFYESLNFTVNSEKLGHKIYKVNLDKLPNNFRLRMEGCYGN